MSETEPAEGFRHGRPRQIENRPYAEYADRWAIVVGISSYQHDSLCLRYAHRDANEFCDWLQTPSGGGFAADHIVKLIDQEATTSNITRALRSFLKRPAREDVVVVYFACHGGPDPDRPGNIYLLTHDTDPGDIAGTALPMREIDLALRENLLAERVVIIADTCHSAAIAANRRASGGSALVNRYLQELSLSKPGTALLTSAEANETAQEGTEWGGGHGVFTHFLLEGLRGAADRTPANGTVTIGELFEYVREFVCKATQGRQHPVIGPSVFDRGLPMAVTGDISAQEHFELGWCLYELGRRLRDPAMFDAALRRLREADRLSTKRRPDVQVLTGKVLLAQDRNEESTLAFREAARIDPGNADACYYLSILQPTTRPTFGEGFPDDPRAAFVQKWASDSRTGTRNCAIVIGIDKYNNIPALGQQGDFGSKNDATQIAKALSRLGFEGQSVELLLDATATKSGIATALRRVAEGTGRIGSFLLYYSGLGFPAWSPGLVVHDSVADGDRVENVLTGQELNDAIMRVPAIHKAVVIDGAIDEQMKPLAFAGGYLVFGATAPHEECHVTGDHGAFTYALLKELKNAALPMASCRSIRERITQQLNSMLVGQNPVVWGDAAKPLVEARSRLDVAFELVETRYYGNYSASLLKDLLDWAQTEGQDHPDISLALARAFLNKRDHQRAIRSLRTISTSAGSTVAEGFLLRAVAHVMAGAEEKARDALNHLAKIETAWSSLFQLEVARLLLALREYNLAMTMAQKSLADQSGVPPAAKAILGLAQAFAGVQESAATLNDYSDQTSTAVAERDSLDRIARFVATGEGPPEKRALLVGISAYSPQTLRAPRIEAEGLRDVLIERYGFTPKNVTALLDQEATYENITGALELAATNAPGNESFLFFYSGHCSSNVERKGSRLCTDLYVPVDALSSHGLDDARMLSGSLLHQLICRIPAADKTVILDAGGVEMTNLAKASNEYLLLTSASPGEYTMDGLFSTELIRQLREATPGSLTVGQLIVATAARMRGGASGLVKGSYPTSRSAKPGSQTPQLIGDPARVLFRPQGAGTFQDRVAVARRLTQLALDPVEIANGLLRFEYSFSTRAVQILARSLRTRPESRPETYLHLGVALGLQGDYTGAFDALNKAIAQSPNEFFPKAHCYLGRFLLESATDYDQAVAELRLAVRQDPTDPHAHYYLAQAIRAQVERQSRVEAADAYRTYVTMGSPLGTDLELSAFTDQKPPDQSRAVRAPDKTTQAASKPPISKQRKKKRVSN